MFWYPVLSNSGFRSIILDSDEASTGKWLIPIPRDDPAEIWDALIDASMSGDLSAVKTSTKRLTDTLGHRLVCVYCQTSDEAAVTETLQRLRDLGVEGDLQYKSDRATDQRREDYLYSSSNFEHPLPKPL